MEVDVGGDDAGQRRQHLVQAGRATGTGHTGDLKQDGLTAVVITLRLGCSPGTAGRRSGLVSSMAACSSMRS